MNYEEPEALNSVAKFHESFGHPINAFPKIPNRERSQLRVNLIQEELNELSEGVVTNDLIEIADALCDIQYVLSGAILEFGLASIFRDLFDEVQRSNMSKACKTEKEASDTVNHFEEQNIPCYFKKKGDYFIVYRTSDNKILKSINYSPADLQKILKSK